MPKSGTQRIKVTLKLSIYIWGAEVVGSVAAAVEVCALQVLSSLCLVLNKTASELIFRDFLSQTAVLKLKI